MHLDRGYDSNATRKRLEERGLLAEISQRRVSPHHLAYRDLSARKL